MQYILFLVLPPSTPPSYSSLAHPSRSIPFLSVIRKEQNYKRQKSNMTKQNIVIWNKNYHIKIELDSPVGGRVPKEGTRVRDPLFRIVGSPIKLLSYQLKYILSGPGVDSCRARVCCCRLWEIIYILLSSFRGSLVSWYPPSFLAFPIILSPLPWDNLSSEGRNLMDSSHLGYLSAKTIFLTVGLCICSHLLPEDASLMMTA